ncbi:hypothetical protein OAJ94_00800 [Deltaproteobacteria bacterium]|nr:hypothetical protein [Deltaproteobacteria bacterium]
MDGRDHGTSRDVSYEIYYAKYDIYSDGPLDGRGEGLNVDNFTLIEETVISNVESNLSSPFAGHSAASKLSIDVRDNIHIAWVDYANNSSIEEIIHTRLNSTNNTGPGMTTLDTWGLETITTWYSNKVGNGIGEELPVSELPAVSPDLGNGVHIAWSDNFSCADKTLMVTFSICHTHVSKGSVSLEMRLPDVNYRNLAPGQLTYYNLTLNNTTPGPVDEVAETYQLGLSGIPANWSTELFFASNFTAIDNTTPLWLNGGESMDLFLKVVTPSVFIANQDEIAEIEVSASSIEDQGISSSLVTWTSMDVVHGIKLNTINAVIDIEQGQTAIFSIAITNLGNVHDSFAFYDSNTLEGQQEWMLPYGWSVDFPTEVELNPGQSIAKNLKVEIPISQEPGTFVLYVKGWSVGEPVKNIAKGTYDVLELWLNVRLKTEGNIIIEQSEEKIYILPEECLDIDYHITKHYQSGSLIFSASIDQADWNTTFDWSDVPGTESDRYFLQDQRYRIGLEVCAPASLPENESATITFTATLVGATYVTSNSIIEAIHYRAPTVEISQPIKNSTVDEMTLFIYGNVSGQQRSGETTVSISLNEDEFNREWYLTDIYKAAKTFDDAVFYVQGSFQFELFLLTKVPNGTGPIIIYLQTCDQKTCYLDELTIIWFQDTDGDGWGDGEDVFPFDPSEWRDSDGDGFGDNGDKFPNDAAEFEDTDGDGVGDWRDQFPTDPSEYVDTDWDGFGDNADEFPLDFNEWFDSDGDGVGDNSDYRPFDPSIQSKSDLNSKNEEKSSTTTGLDDVVILSLGGVAIILIILVVIMLLVSNPKRKEDILTSYDSSFGPIEENEWLPVPNNERFFPTPVEQTFVEPQPISQPEPQPISQPDPFGINQLLPPSGPPAPPVASIPSNNGIRDGYEWLATNGLDYYRPTGSMAEWKRWN